MNHSCLCYCVQDVSSVLAVVRGGVFWLTVFGHVTAEWCLYLLLSASPVYLHDISHVGIHSYLVSVASCVIFKVNLFRDCLLSRAVEFATAG